jgi:hypothetical protein
MLHGKGETELSTMNQKKVVAATTQERHLMERETGFEPATSTLARLHSTAELFPLSRGI